MLFEKEKDIQGAICDYLALRKIFFWRNNTTPIYDPTRNVFRAMSKYALKGRPDIEIIKGGSYIGLEVKTPRTRQNVFQVAFEKQCKEAGGKYHLVRSLNDVIELGL